MFRHFLEPEVAPYPSEAWSFVASFDRVPLARFVCSDVRAISDRWWRSATERDLFDKNHDVLMSFGGAGGLPWALVHIDYGSPFFEELMHAPGDIEFVCLSVRGGVLIAVVAVEDDVWIVDGVYDPNIKQKFRVRDVVDVMTP